MLLDVAAVEIGLWLSGVIRPALNSWSFIKPILTEEVIPPALYWIFPLVWLVIYLVLSIYDGKKYLRVADELGILSLGMLIASICAAGILYLSYRQMSRASFLIFVTINFLLALGWRLVIRIITRVKKVPPEAEKKVLVVGSGPLAHKIFDHLAQSSLRPPVFLGYVDDERDQHTTPPLLGDTTEIKSLVLDHHATDVIIALPYSAYPQLGPIVQQLEEVPVRVWVALGFFDLALYKTTIEDFSGIPMIDLRALAIDDFQLMVKRVFDLVICLLLLLISLPGLLLIGLAILLEDGRPVFFKQKRAGENGREFEIIKFRTMIRGAEKMAAQVEITDEQGNKILKHRNDPRVTRVGRFLRRFSLDELPQLINIIKGDMSLVGPRPEIPELVEKYQPWQRKRFAIPQGLTGWWQIHGRSDKPMYLHTEDDLYYIQHYSIWLDIFILISTFWAVIRGKGAY